MKSEEKRDTRVCPICFPPFPHADLRAIDFVGETVSMREQAGPCGDWRGRTDGKSERNERRGGVIVSPEITGC